MVKYVISQIIALFAVASLASTYIIKNKKLILSLVIFSSFCFALQYVLLDAPSGVASNLIGILASIWYFINEKRGKNQDLVSICIVLLTYLICGILTFKIWVDIVVMLSSMLFTYSIWQPKVLVYRWCGIVNSLLWITYNVVYFAIVSAIFEVVTLIVKIVGLIKYYVDLNKVKAENKVTGE